MSETAHQMALIQWVRLQEDVHPDLKLLYAIPNGEFRHRITAIKLKKQGVLAGVPDLHLPVARGGFIGLWIEMKYGKNKQTPAQIEYAAKLEAVGHRYRVCYDWNDAQTELLTYLSMFKTKEVGRS